MGLHFSEEELAERRARVIGELKEQELDGLLMFKPESMYYLTGYDSTGYIVFQCLYLGLDGTLTLLTRAPDVRQASYTSMIDDVRVWVDREGANPGEDLRQILEEHGCQNDRLGIERDTFGLTANHGKMVEDALDGVCTLDDQSHLVDHQRLIKSDAELEYVRRAAELADDALEEANRLARPGTDEGELYAAMHDTIFRGGGFYPASRFAIGSGDKALLVRTVADNGTIGEHDQVQLEFAGTYMHYHAALMRTILTTEARPEHVEMHKASVEALKACQEVCRPGNTVGDVFDAHAEVYDEAGYRDCRLNACGYSLGATYAPSWMDWPMFYTGNPVVLKPNMVFFMHMILVDEDRDLTMSLGETVVVTEDGCEPLSSASHDLVVNE